MKDVNLKLRASSAGNLNASADGSWVDFGGPDLVVREYQIDVPQAAGTTPTLTLQIQDSNNGSTVNEKVEIPVINAAGQYFVRAKFKGRYRRFSAVLGGTTPNFGAVEICPVPGGRYEKH